MKYFKLLKENCKLLESTGKVISISVTITRRMKRLDVYFLAINLFYKKNNKD